MSLQKFRAESLIQKHDQAPEVKAPEVKKKVTSKKKSK